MIVNFLVVLCVMLNVAFSCTNLLVTKGASIDGSNIISYNADAANFYTTIYHYPAGTHANGTMRNVYSWDYGTFMGSIPEAAVTYNVVGNVNEFGLIITESTFDGLNDLACTKRQGIIDYGSLIYITLQRAKTASEAITVMAGLVRDYGYGSTGESFSIADQTDMWYMELIGKGNFEKGAVWVARKVPDGYVTGHANQARITTFPLDDPENCRYSSDVVTFAKKNGFFKGFDFDFSFSEVYDPISVSGARFCEARVWSFFTTVMGKAWSDQYLDYAQGVNLSNRMPLWVLPPKKISAQDIMENMRSHYENTALDMTGKMTTDVGAGPYGAAVRASPLTWSSSASGTKKSYFHERAIAQGPTGWSIVCQSRPNVPAELAALMWFGIDDSSTSVHFPVYGAVTRVPAGWAGPGPQDGVAGPMMTFSLDSAFYVFNLVANYAYTRWDDIYPDVKKAILTKEAEYLSLIAAKDAEVLAVLNSGDRAGGLEKMTVFSETLGVQLLKDWFGVFGQLFVKFRDGFITTAAPLNPVCGCSTSSRAYPQTWYDSIATETKDRYVLPVAAVNETPRSTDKLELLARFG